MNITPMNFSRATTMMSLKNARTFGERGESGPWCQKLLALAAMFGLCTTLPLTCKASPLTLFRTADTVRLPYDSDGLQRHIEPAADGLPDAGRPRHARTATP